MDPLPLDSSNRRYFELTCSTELSGKKDDLAVKKRLDDLIGTPKSSLAKFLYDFNLAGFDQTNLPHTAEMIEKKIRGLPTPIKWLVECCNAERIGSDEFWEKKLKVDLENQLHKPNRFHENSYMSREQFYAIYKSWCSAGKYKPGTEDNFMAMMKVLGIGKNCWWYRRQRDNSFRIVLEDVEKVKDLIARHSTIAKQFIFNID